MLLLPLLALAAAWSYGQAQVVLKQREVSITRGHTTTASMDCIAEGVTDFQNAHIHWYRHAPSKAPERILYIGPSAVSYDENFYSNKYSSLKKDKNVCTFIINDINSNDEGKDLFHWTTLEKTVPRKSCEDHLQRQGCKLNQGTYRNGDIALLSQTAVGRAAMKFHVVRVFTPSCPCVDMQSVPVQTPELLTEMKGMTASMSCELQRKDVVHWYRQLPGEPPKRILFVSGGTPVFDIDDRNRFEVRNDPSELVYGLKINSLTPRDSGTYYCAYYRYHNISWAKISLTKRLFVL